MLARPPTTEETPAARILTPEPERVVWTAVPFRGVYPSTPGLEGPLRTDAIVLQFLHGVFLQVLDGPATPVEEQRDALPYRRRFQMLFEAHRGLLPAFPSDPAVRRILGRLEDALLPAWSRFLEDSKRADTFAIAHARSDAARLFRKLFPWLREDGEGEEEGWFLRELSLLLARLARNSFLMTSACERMDLFLAGFRGYPRAVFVEASTRMSHTCGKPSGRLVCRDGTLELFSRLPPTETSQWEVNMADHLAPDFERASDWCLRLQQPASEDVLHGLATRRHREEMELRFGTPCTCSIPSVSLEAELRWRAVQLEQKISGRCGFCEKWSTSAPMPHCGRCRRQKYCDRRCQSLDWPRHKPTCEQSARLFDPKTLQNILLQVCGDLPATPS